MHTAESGRSLNTELLVMPSLRVTDPKVLHPSATVCHNTHRILPIREIHLSLCAEFLLRLDHILPMWLTFGLQPLWFVRLMALVPVPLEVATNTECSGVLHHKAHYEAVQRPDSQANKDTPIRQAIQGTKRSPLSSTEQRHDLYSGMVNSSLYSRTCHKVSTQTCSVV